jgi:endonuclease-3
MGSDEVRLVEMVEALGRGAPAAAPMTDPLRLILWDNIGALIDDALRRELFDAFEAATGCMPARIATADDAVLYGIARRGGMRPEVRMERWREIARITLAEAGGDLMGALRSLPVAKARALLKRFPVIGDPGADKILLFTGLDARPSIESNGLRVLVRLGLVAQASSYGATYKAAVGLLARAGDGDRDWLIGAYAVLRQHGKTLCRRSAPSCLACPADSICAHAPASGL